METIKCFLDEYNLHDSQSKNYCNETINDIAQILNGIIKESYDKELYCNYSGMYYRYKIKDFKLAEKYYLMAIEKDFVSSMNNLRCMYCDQEKYDLAKKYLLMAIDKNNRRAMNNLGYMYTKLKQYDLAEKYYLLAIERDNTNAMNNLGVLYQQREQYEIAEKYYTMAVEKNNSNKLFNRCMLSFEKI